MLGKRLYGVGKSHGLAGNLGMEQFHHPAVEGDGAFTLIFRQCEGGEDRAGLLDFARVRGKGGVAGLYLGGVDQGLAVKTHGPALDAGGSETRTVRNVIVNSVDDGEVVRAGGHDCQVQGGDEGLPARRMAGPHFLHEIIRSHHEAGKAAACAGDLERIEDRARGLDHEPERATVRGAGHRSLGRADLRGVVDLGHKDRVGTGCTGRVHVLSTPGRVDAIDPDDHFTLAEAAVTNGVADELACQVLGFRCYRVFEIEDQGVGGQCRRLLEGPGVGTGHVEHAAAGTDGHLLSTSLFFADPSRRLRGSQYAIQHTILTIQSEVVRGHVGNSAARFALQRLGLEAWALPTVLLSHHPGHGRPEGRTTPAQELTLLVESLVQRGWAGAVQGLITGYLGSAEQAGALSGIVARVKALNPGALYLCDPVFGDDGGAYAKPGVAEAIARDLLPLADIAAPNRFELSSLTSQRIDGPADAVRAARLLGLREVVVTSVPDGERIANVCVTASDAWCCSVRREDHVPHGTGDLLSALYLALRVSGLPAAEALAGSVARVQAIVGASLGRDELMLIAAQDQLVSAPGVMSATRLS